MAEARIFGAKPSSPSRPGETPFDALRRQLGPGGEADVAQSSVPKTESPARAPAARLLLVRPMFSFGAPVSHNGGESSAPLAKPSEGTAKPPETRKGRQEPKEEPQVAAPASSGPQSTRVGRWALFPPGGHNNPLPPRFAVPQVMSPDEYARTFHRPMHLPGPGGGRGYRDGSERFPSPSDRRPLVSDQHDLNPPRFAHRRSNGGPGGGMHIPDIPGGGGGGR